MSRSIVFAACLLVAAAVTAAPAQTSSRAVRVDIDSHGTIIGAEPIDKLDPALDQAIRKALTEWRFQPPMYQGAAVQRARTVVRLELIPHRVEDGASSLEIRYRTHGPYLDRMGAPTYPEAMLRNHAMAFVAADFDVAADGTAGNIDITSAVAGWPVHRSFGESARSAIAKAHFEPELVDDRPVPGHMRTKINYALPSQKLTHKQIELLRAHAQAAGAADAGDDALPSLPEPHDDPQSYLTMRSAPPVFVPAH